MSNRPMIPGVEFDFGGGRVYLVPPLSLGALEVLQERVSEMVGLPATDPRAIKTTIEAAHLALKRNYPDITRDTVAELVDLGNMGDVFEALMDVSGVKRRAQEQEREQGKVTAKTPEGGEGSSPASAPSPAGPGTT